MDKLLSRILNPLSMYTVMSIALTILWVTAFVLSLTGTLEYSPFAMIASLGVLGVSTFVFSLLFGRLFRVSVHTESSYITSLILALIFTPTVSIGGLIVLAMVGLIAAASKFALTVKGRHIFNPAALAAFVISVAGLGYASWWVATPALFIPTFLLGFFIIYKTRRFLTGGIFIGLSTVLVLLFLVSQGNSLTDSLILLLSWPIFFFSGFMLTEPLTFPRKKKHQIIEVLIVAPIFAIPIGLGDFTTTPALALIIGNLFAFIVSKRQLITLRYEGSKQLTEKSRELIFSAEQPIEYEAGEYMELTLPHKHKDMRGIRRSFSVTSAANEQKVSFGIKFYEPSSTFKKALLDLPIGKKITATSINGDFILPEDKSVPIVYIAGGIGITPFISHLRTMKRNKQKRNIVLFYLVSSEKDLAYLDDLKRLRISLFVITKNIKTTPLKGFMHINENHLTVEVIRQHLTDVPSRTAFISGPPLMVDEAKKVLRTAGVKKIKTDYFIGY